MTSGAIACVLLSIAAFLAVGNVVRRPKRDLLDLADMFDLGTGLDPTDYIPYGNWCGFGGYGKAIDLIDSCCEIHDKCYESVEEHCSEQVHIVQYDWAIENKTIFCGKNQGLCELNLCVCDREVVECIARHNHTYSEDYRFIKKFR